MSAAELIARVERAGGRLVVEGDRLILRHPPHPDAKLVEALREPKAEALAYLRRRQAETRRADPYWQAAQRALERIAEQGRDLPDIRAWAQQYHHGIWQVLTEHLPENWAALWDAGAPLGEFQAALDTWVDAHAELCRMFTWAQMPDAGVAGDPGQ